MIRATTHKSVRWAAALAVGFGLAATVVPAPVRAGDEVAARAAAGDSGHYVNLATTEQGQASYVNFDGETSARHALNMTLSDLSGIFGKPGHVTGGFTDGKDHDATVYFKAVRRGVAMRGMVVATIGAKGASVGVVFDAADAPKANFAMLESSLPRVAPVKWQEAEIPDGTGSLRLPSDWKIAQGGGDGSVDADGPDGQSIHLGKIAGFITPDGEAAYEQLQRNAGSPIVIPTQIPVMPMGTPAESAVSFFASSSREQRARGGAGFTVKAVESAPVQWPVGQAAFVHLVTQSSDAAHNRCEVFGLFAVAPAGGGAWTLYYSAMFAPQGVFERDMPVMSQAWSSWRVDQAVYQRRLADAMRTMHESNQILERATAVARTAKDYGTADFDEMIRGHRTVEDTETGERREADLGYVTKVVDKLNEAAGYPRFKEIPLRDQ